MGYEISMDVSVKIPLSKEKKLMKVLKSLDNGKKYRWVSEGFGNYETVEEIFEEWRYGIRRDNTHFIIDEWNGQKIGNDDLLWETLESLVEPDSIIEVEGEDGAKWKYTFKNNIFKESHGTTVYDDEAPEKETKTKNTDPYILLGIKKESTKQEIDSAFKKLAKKFHPDNFVSLDSDFEEIAKAKTQELNYAREYCLKNLK